MSIPQRTAERRLECANNVLGVYPARCFFVSYFASEAG